VAKALAERIDDKTIIVASSDLSHYHSYQAAKNWTPLCQGNLRLDIDAMTTQKRAARTPILALLHIAHQKGWKAQCSTTATVVT